MENTDPVRAPNSDTDWQAIDIFVFSNGQQYSPPRKYHLQAEDINFWKSTLAFLAKTQYGPFHSTVDLFTIGGRKVTNPLELSNGGSYVAVQPPDSFIDSGYDKYLIKATRSWEKRRVKKIENTLESELVRDNPETSTVIKKITELVEDSDIKTREASAVLKRLSSNNTSQDASTIIKPQLLTPLQRNSQITAKQTEKRKSSIQPPRFVRKLTPTLLPSPNLRNPFKKNDSLKANVKITKLEGSKNSSITSGYSGANASSKIGLKSKLIRPPAKTKDILKCSTTILSNVPEAVNEIKSTSATKVVTTNNDEGLSTNSVNLKENIEEKELIKVSSVYKNPHREMTSIALNPFQKHSIVYYPMRQNATTTVLAQYSSTNTGDVTNKINNANTVGFPEKEERTNGYDVQESIRINHNFVSNSAHESKSVEKLSNNLNLNPTLNLTVDENKDSTYEINIPKIHEIEYKDQAVAFDKSNIGSNSKVKIDLPKIHNINLPSIEKLNTDSSIINIPKIYDTNVPILGKDNTQDLPPRKRSVTIDHLTDKLQDKPNFVDNLEEKCNKESVVNARKSNETIKIYNFSHRKTSITSNTVMESQPIILQSKQTEDFLPTATDKLLSDQYKATVKKGDVVNLKFSIEIESREVSPRNYDDILKTQSVTIIQTEKESQNIIDDQLIIQNKSLLNLINKEFKHHTGDNNKRVIVQCSNCKCYNDSNTTTGLDNKRMYKSYLILLPIEKLEDATEMCQCDNDEPRVINVAKTSHSCTSLSKSSKSPIEPQDDNTARSIYVASDPKSNENAVTVVRKKSVAIIDELPMLNAREPSIITQEIDVKLDLIEISMESSVGILTKGIKTDVSTQTNWCDVLLEARLLCNGHYTFRLPALELLKSYKLT